MVWVSLIKENKELNKHNNIRNKEIKLYPNNIVKSAAGWIDGD